MGGLGSGKSYGRGRKKRGMKLFTTDLLQLHIPSLMRLHNNGGSGRYVWIDTVQVTVEGKEVHLLSDKLKPNKIHILAIECGFGGYRYVVYCPRCGWRVKSLYLLKEELLGCRHCFRMAYRSQNQNKHTRLVLKWFEVRDKINDDPWNKPKWMRKRTFEKLREQYYDLDEKAQIADVCSLRNNRQVDVMFERHGGVEGAGEAYLASYGISI